MLSIQFFDESRDAAHMHNREIGERMVKCGAVIGEYDDVVNGDGNLPRFELMLQKKLVTICLVKRVGEVFADILLDTGKFMEGWFVEKGTGDLFYFHDDDKMWRNEQSVHLMGKTF